MIDKYRQVAISATSPIEQTQRHRVIVEPYADDRGWIQNAGFVLKRISALEKGTIDGPRAIVLHRTDSLTSESALKSFEEGVGTHFIIDKDGVIQQCASLLKRTQHVGKIRSKCFEAGNCSIGEAQMIKSWGWAPTRIYNHEKSKAYPHRFPMNEDSIGIETVAKFDGTYWEKAWTGQTSVDIHEPLCA